MGFNNRRKGERGANGVQVFLMNLHILESAKSTVI
jgi:hypothetical protein